MNKPIKRIYFITFYLCLGILLLGMPQAYSASNNEKNSDTITPNREFDNMDTSSLDYLTYMISHFIEEDNIDQRFSQFLAQNNLCVITHKETNTFSDKKFKLKPSQSGQNNESSSYWPIKLSLCLLSILYLKHSNSQDSAGAKYLQLTATALMAITYLSILPDLGRFLSY